MSSAKQRCISRLMRMAVLFGASAAFVVATTQFAEASPRDIEFDLRDSTYIFGVPGSSLGPWKSEKFDAIAATQNNRLLFHAVSTNRNDPSQGAHGEFARVEDDHRFGTSTIRLATGLGGGVLGQRTMTLAIAQTMSTDRRFTLTAGVDLTALAPDNFQRVVGIGPELALGRMGVVARYYHATATKFAVQPPASAIVVVSTPLAKNFDVSVATNFGGEVNADRTSAYLPTSSGRYGTDLSLSARVGIDMRTSLLATYEGAAFRASSTGSLSRIQHVITVGLALKPLHK